MSTPMHPPYAGRGGAHKRLRDVGLVCTAVALVLMIPPVLFGALSYQKFGFFRLSYYVPYEELLAALRTANPLRIAEAPVVSVDLTSGFAVASMFTLSVGQLFLSVVLGILVGLHVVALLTLRGTCPVGNTAGTASAAGSGLIATIMASGTGILGCCGPSLSGGMLALLGVGAGTAHTIAHVSPAVQVAVTALVAVGYVRLRRRVRYAAASRPVSGEARGTG